MTARKLSCFTVSFILYFKQINSCNHLETLGLGGEQGHTIYSDSPKNCCMSLKYEEMRTSEISLAPGSQSVIRAVMISNDTESMRT